MNRIWPVIGVCALVLGGCAEASRQAYTTHYTIAAPARSALHGPTEPGSGKTLQVARMTVPPWLQGTDMDYRLDYLHDNRIAAYGRSDWVAPPAGLLEQMVRNAIAGDGFWRAVIGPASPAQADMSLHIRIDDFSQVFTSPQQSHGVLDATATLIGDRDDNVVAQKHFHIEAPAPTADAPGGVEALKHVGREFAARLQGWLRATVEHPHSGDSTARHRQASGAHADGMDF
jgi:cholesterol transport system auxiliary component